MTLRTQLYVPVFPLSEREHVSQIPQAICLRIIVSQTSLIGTRLK
jgi:hypothetical protein